MQIREASVVLQRDWERTGAAARLVAVPDRTIDESETDVEQRMEAMKGVEAALAERTSTACEILAAADERDAVADARDLAADRREHDLDLAQFLAVDGDYGHDWPERRAAALARAAHGQRHDNALLGHGCIPRGTRSRKALVSVFASHPAYSDWNTETRAAHDVRHYVRFSNRVRLEVGS
jgi:hypothetical protein